MFAGGIEIDEEVQKMFLPAGKGMGGPGVTYKDVSTIPNPKERMVVTLVPNFHQLQQISHELSVPVTMMSKATLEKHKQKPMNKDASIQNIDLKKEGQFALRVQDAFKSLARYIDAIQLP